MENSYNSFSNVIKKKLMEIIALVVLIIVFLIAIAAVIINDNSNESKLTDTVEKQRTLSQRIAKEANNKYAIMLTLQQGNLAVNENIFEHEIEISNNAIKTSENKFNDILSGFNKGILDNNNNKSLEFDNKKGTVKQSIEKLNNAWISYDKYVNLIKSSNQVDSQMSSALIYINEHSNELMEYSDTILKEIIDNKHHNFFIIIFSLICIFVLLLIMFVISLFNLKKYIIYPLNEFYYEIGNIGVKRKKPLFFKEKQMYPIVNQINESVDKLNQLISLMAHINQDVAFDDTLKYIYKSFSSFIPYAHIGIALLKEDGAILEASYGISDKAISDLPQKLIGIRERLSKTSLEKIVSDGTPRIINDLEEYTKGSSALYNKILLEYGIKSSITLPLKIDDKPLGIIFFSSLKKDAYNEGHVMFLSSLADSIAISFNKNIFIDELIYSIVLALAKMAEARDEDTGDHLERMKNYARLISELLVEDHIYEDLITVKFIKDIERYSPMHDIGKVGVRDGILLKPGKLTSSEFSEMKKHTLYGAGVLKAADNNIKKHKRSLFRIGIEIAEGHHEKWDGSGYPYGKKDSDIPLSARIVAVADVFDALTSKRPYKKAFPFEDSVNIILEGRGKHFDPQIVDTFIKHKDRIYKMYMEFWNK